MRADSSVFHKEARRKLKDAMLSYPGDPVHVVIFGLFLQMDWNDLQTALARSDHPAAPGRVSTICEAVDNHLETEMRNYLGIK